MIKHCAWCDTEFDTEYTIQVYCSAQCRERATREKILARYQQGKQKKRAGKTRKCAGGCGTNLSIYNNSALCARCAVNKKKFSSFLEQLKGMAGE